MSLKVYPTEGTIMLPCDQFNDQNTTIILKNFDALNFDIAVVQYPDKTFKAFELQCTHQPNNRLIATQEGFICHAHGSQFDKNGQVKKAPAKKALKEFKLELINNKTIKITL